MVKPAKGTTTLAFIFKEGVMVAADSRASMGGYISSQSVKKIIEINPYMLGTMAGGAADCQFWHRNLGIKLRKYSGKRPEVIAIAIEKPVAILADEINTKLSGKYLGLGMSTLSKAVDGHGKGNESTALQVKDDSIDNASGAEGDLSEEDNTASGPEGYLSEEDNTASGAEGDLSESEDSDEFWKPFITSLPVEKSISADNSFVSPKEQKSNLKKDDSEDIDEAKSEETSNSEAKSSKSVKRNKWKTEEVKKLIGMREELSDRFQVVKGRMALWEEISQKLLADGISRSPGQCKSLWTSLVVKYEGIKNEDRKKSWPYIEDMERIMSDKEAPAK